MEEIDLYFEVNGTIKLTIEELYIAKFHNDDNTELPHPARMTNKPRAYAVVAAVSVVYKILKYRI